MRATRMPVPVFYHKDDRNTLIAVNAFAVFVIDAVDFLVLKAQLWFS